MDLHGEIRQLTRTIADEQIAPYAAEVDRESRFPEEARVALTAADLQAPHIPEEYGGAGMDAVGVCIVIEEVARACASSSLIPAVNKLGTAGMLLAGSPEICARYLPQVASGAALFSYALSEPDAGSDAAAMKSRAVPTESGWLLNGVKRWITNAGVSQFYTVMAVTDPDKGARGISSFVVHADDPGVSFGAKESKLGIKGSPTREVYFDDVELPADRIIGEIGTGFATALRTLDHTRPTIAAQAVGIAQGALDFAIGYIKERRQFGKPISDFQGIQFMVAEMGMQLEAARQLTYEAARLAEDGDTRATYSASAAKCFASDVANMVTGKAVELLGGYGFTTDYPVERMLRDAKITQIYEGTNQIQRVVMARHLLA